MQNISNIEAGRSENGTRKGIAKLQSGQTNKEQKSKVAPSGRTNSEIQGGEGRVDQENHLVIAPVLNPNPSEDGRSGQNNLETHVNFAGSQKSRKGKAKVGDDHMQIEAQFGRETPDLRFIDPLVMEIVQMHRMRRRWVKARNSLILQGKAFGRAVVGGDKEDGSKAFDRVAAGKTVDGDEVLMIALSPFIPAIERFDKELSAIEKDLERLAKKLPVAEWVKDVRGFGFASLASIVGEAGDLSAYPTVSGVWKRLGLAVIDGDGRQRKCADADRALAHGYNPERRSVVWNVAEPISRLQRTWIDKETGEIKKPADPYGAFLEIEKAKALATGLTPAHSEARAKRHMMKRILRDLTVAWKRQTGQEHVETQRCAAGLPQFMEAAE